MSTSVESGRPKPRGLMRIGLRVPIFLYRINLCLLGRRFLLLTHIGASYFTTSTGQGACSTTRSVTLPIRMRREPRLPTCPMTIKSTACSRARSAISS